MQIKGTRAMIRTAYSGDARRECLNDLDLRLGGILFDIPALLAYCVHHAKKRNKFKGLQCFWQIVENDGF